MWFYFSFRGLKCKVKEKSGVLPNSLLWKISESLQLFYFHKTNVLLNNLSKRFNQKVGIKYWFLNPIYQISWLKTHIICIGEPEIIVVQRRQRFFIINLVIDYLHRCSLNDRESFHHYTWLHAPLIPPFLLVIEQIKRFYELKCIPFKELLKTRQDTRYKTNQME